MNDPSGPERDFPQGTPLFVALDAAYARLGEQLGDEFVADDLASRDERVAQMVGDDPVGKIRQWTADGHLQFVVQRGLEQVSDGPVAGAEAINPVRLARSRNRHFISLGVELYAEGRKVDLPLVLPESGEQLPLGFTEIVASPESPDFVANSQDVATAWRLQQEDPPEVMMPYAGYPDLETYVDTLRERGLSVEALPSDASNSVVSLAEGLEVETIFSVRENYYLFTGVYDPYYRPEE